MPLITRPQSLPPCKRGCTEWCVSFCPKRSSDRRNCWDGWRMFNSATNGPDAPTRNAAPHWVATPPAFHPNPSL